MTKARSPGDPWYTVLYRDPHRFWWTPAVVTFAVMLAVRRIFGGETWRESLLFAGITGAVFLLTSGLRHRSRQGS